MTDKRPDWDEYFLNIAEVVATRATCLRRRYGAVIVSNNIIVSTGYNGAPRGEPNCLDKGGCLRDQLGVAKGERYELCVGVHAEQNAIINGSPAAMAGATIYVVGVNCHDSSYASGEPCLLCRRMLKNARIERVVYRDRSGGIISCPVATLADAGEKV
ncbi:MAG: dCMP deaminase family protein [Negativicutes bacterium]|nr:dCMP deaminase family protein [Negativicutes bacterium]